MSTVAAPAKKKKKRRLRRLLLLATISSVLAIALAEVSLRVASALLYPPIYDLDEDLGWRHAHGVIRMLTDETGKEVLFSTDANGMRINPTRLPDAAPERTLLFLGDSFTQASQVNAEDSFVARVETQLKNTRCLNAGVGGYSTVQERLALGRLLPQWTPDVVVLVVYENDFVDNLMPFFSGLGPRPYARLDEDEVDIVLEQDVASFEPYLQPAPAAFWLYRHCALYRSVHKTIFLKSHGEELAKREEHERSQVTRADQRRVMAELLAQVHGICQANDRELRIVALPSRGMARSNKAPSHAWLAATCEQMGVPFLSLQETLQGHDKDAYFAHDIHFTAAGHELVAEALVPFLKD